MAPGGAQRRGSVQPPRCHPSWEQCGDAATGQGRGEPRSRGHRRGSGGWRLAGAGRSSPCGSAAASSASAPAALGGGQAPAPPPGRLVPPVPGSSRAVPGVPQTRSCRSRWCCMRKRMAAASTDPTSPKAVSPGRTWTQGLRWGHRSSSHRSPAAAAAARAPRPGTAGTAGQSQCYCHRHHGACHQHWSPTHPPWQNRGRRSPAGCRRGGSPAI